MTVVTEYHHLRELSKLRFPEYKVKVMVKENKFYFLVYFGNKKANFCLNY
mgnify:CR=1 FL=1|jgi:hypothetical protein